MGGLLNTFFSTWSYQDIGKRLPFIYNMTASATYSYLPAFKKYGKGVKIIHFVGATKPWQTSFDSSGEAILGGSEAHTLSYLRLWWQLYSTEVKPALVAACTQEAPFPAEGELIFVLHSVTTPSPG